MQYFIHFKYGPCSSHVVYILVILRVCLFVNRFCDSENQVPLTDQHGVNCLLSGLILLEVLIVLIFQLFF